MLHHIFGLLNLYYHKSMVVYLRILIEKYNINRTKKMCRNTMFQRTLHTVYMSLNINEAWIKRIGAGQGGISKGILASKMQRGPKTTFFVKTIFYISCFSLNFCSINQRCSIIKKTAYHSVGDFFV